MKFSREIEEMCPVKKGACHKCAPIPQEGRWDNVTEVNQINGFTHGVGGCAPQQGACKLSLNIKNGIIEEALIETIGCSGMTQSAAMASEILPGKTVLEALNTDLVCDAINVAMRNLFLQIAYGRSQSAFSEDGLVVGAGLEDLKFGRSQVGTMYSTREKGPRYLELDSGYITKIGLDKNNEIIGYEFINLGKLMERLKTEWAENGDDVDYNKVFSDVKSVYGRYKDAEKYIDPRPAKETKKGAAKTALSENFEGFDLRINSVLEGLKKYGISSLSEVSDICEKYGVKGKVIDTVSAQADAFDNARWAYLAGTAMALKKGEELKANGKELTAIEAAKIIGEGLQSFCIPGSVADIRKVGKGHGDLGARLLDEETKCFAFLAGHESFAAARGAIKIAETADKVRKEPLRVILNGLGKDAAYLISRICGFTFVETHFNHHTGKLDVISETAFSSGSEAKVRCYGADDVLEGVAIMKHEQVDVSITGNSTNPTRFQHPVAAEYKKWCIFGDGEENFTPRKYYSVASGGGTGRTLHPDNVAAGPASYGLTDTMGRMHSDAQFAGSSSVAAHVDMMGFIGLGNNPMVGATVACAVEAAQALKNA